MRLNQIKLSGFKSFADPTTFQLPGQLVGVVGPNGCGKSNIMDAVRWVLGESKASELRGESMQDVIFNGSGQRKPAGRASVELVFDNASARAGGQWNAFAEIAVKRVLTREGTSSYFINNQAVRRRDVQDVFLGTGLGPRAYAIIGQGTISRIIESRPEELRLFLEEAAGVSKYKERRRETENRLKDTRENLLRVEDILRELDANLEKLERQAAVAQRYKSLQTEGTTRLHQMWFLKARDAQGEQERIAQAIGEATVALESGIAQLRHVEAELETLRQTHLEAGDRLHQAQGALGEAGLEVSRLEERIRYLHQSRQKLAQQLADLRQQDVLWAQRREDALAELEQLAEQQAQSQESEAVLAAQVEDQAARQPEAEEAWRRAQQAAQAQRTAVAQVQQQLQVLSVEGRSRDEQSRQLRSRRDRLQQDFRQLDAPEPAQLAEAARQASEAQALLDEALARQETAQQERAALEEQRRLSGHDQQAQAGRLADVSARLEALRGLQAQVQSQGRLKPWLDRHGLTDLAALWTHIQVASGWEAAVEAVLRERLQALPVSRLDRIQALEQDVPAVRLAFFETQRLADGPHPVPQPRLDWPVLRAQVRTADAGLQALLDDWLSGVYVQSELAHALSRRSELQPGELILTPAGHAVSARALAFYAPDSEQAGMLARAQTIEMLQREQQAQRIVADAAQASLVRAEAALSQAQTQATALGREVQQAQAQRHQAQVQQVQLAQRAEASTLRADQLREELAVLDDDLAAIEEARAEAEARFETLDLALADVQERQAQLDDDVIAAERRWQDAREQQRLLERRLQEASYQLRSLDARRAELQRTVEMADRQVQTHRQTGTQLEMELGALDDDGSVDGLQQALDRRVACEQALLAERLAYDGIHQRLREAQEERLSVERSIEPLRETLSRLQLEAQAAELGGAQYLTQLQAAQVDLDQLAATIEADQVKLYGLQSEIDRIQREIQSLGAVNLAALEELARSRERQGFLSAQVTDLNAAIQTLEDAIRKIDSETRDLLRSTFDQVNTHFGRLFPSLFGGGSARLSMTGDDILDTGVQVLAQPPGKKNATIHLLSGGEKALTAIALVFAIFQLNPAPFCLLDEVDAPLDDANTERYGKLVATMSQSTQFLFISHNKIAMEIAQQLIGVTMQEQGVSRIVAVDMETASRWAGATA